MNQRRRRDAGICDDQHARLPPSTSFIARRSSAYRAFLVVYITEVRGNRFFIPMAFLIFIAKWLLIFIPIRIKLSNKIPVLYQENSCISFTRQP